MPKRILREVAAAERLGIKRSLFRRDFTVLNPHADSDFVPGTRQQPIKRLKPVPIGGRIHGFLESEIDALIDALVAERDGPERKPKAAQPKPNSNINMMTTHWWSGSPPRAAGIRVDAGLLPFE
jgi:hypothetical protein